MHTSASFGSFSPLLGKRQLLLDDLVEGRDLRVRLTQIVVVMTLGAGLYGAVLGLWRAPLQAVYVAIKLPLVVVVTSCLTVIFNWMLAVLLGVRMTFGQVAAFTLLALAVASVVLASLAPVALVFTLSAPEPSNEARTTHNLLYLFHTLFIGGAGLAGTSTMRGLLDRICPDPSRSRKLHLAWITTFAFVGGEVAWSLRPFVGSVFLPVVFLREDAFQGNMYEFIIRDILPHLLHGN